jgi:hypothetical protein
MVLTDRLKAKLFSKYSAADYGMLTPEAEFIPAISSIRGDTFGGLAYLVSLRDYGTCRLAMKHLGSRDFLVSVSTTGEQVFTLLATVAVSQRIDETVFRLLQPRKSL